MVARPLRIGKTARRIDARTCARHAPDLTDDATHAQAAPIALPITRDEVRVIASAGFPLWEPLDTLQLRNRRITLAYGDLSHQLARLIASSDDEGDWDANWCTFATWSSRTIGTCIDRQPEHGLVHRLVRPLPPALRELAFRASERLLGRGHGAIYRTLAIGNRLVFLEIGTAVSHFLDYFESASYESQTDFDDYWSEMQHLLADLSHLDPSWVATTPPDPATLEAGMRAYCDALTEPDPKVRSELVLLGNLLLGAYEQTRVDTYLTATLSLFTTTWLHRIIRGQRRGVVSLIVRGLEAPISTLYALLSTQFFLVIELPTEVGMADLRVGSPVPPIRGSDKHLVFPETLQHIVSPPLQAVLTRYDLSDRRNARTRATNWTSFADRMNYITNLFRSRQRETFLFCSPWSPDQESCLLKGRLPT